MNILEYARAIEKSLEINFNPSLNIFQCQFEKMAEIKDGSCLIGMWGGGKTAEDSISEYAQKIKGRRLVFNADNEKRQEFNVPNDLNFKQLKEQESK